jgi:hypothetical protein
LAIAEWFDVNGSQLKTRVGREIESREDKLWNFSPITLKLVYKLLSLEEIDYAAHFSND